MYVRFAGWSNAFKLSREGDLEWQTSPDEIPGYALSAVESPVEDFLILVDECLGSIILQKLNGDGVVSFPTTVSETDMSFSGKIIWVNGSLCFFSSVEPNRFKAFYLDSNFEIDRIVEFDLTPESNGILFEMTEKGLLIAGSTEYGNALLTMFDLDGNFIRQQVYDTGREEILSGARWLDNGILAFGRIQNPLGRDASLWILKTDNLGLVEDAHITDSGIQEIDSHLITLDCSFWGESYLTP